MTFPEIPETVFGRPGDTEEHPKHSRLTEEELIAKWFPPGTVIEMNSPILAFEAAAILMKLMEEHRAFDVVEPNCIIQEATSVL